MDTVVVAVEGGKQVNLKNLSQTTGLTGGIYTNTVLEWLVDYSNTGLDWLEDSNSYETRRDYCLVTDMSGLLAIFSGLAVLYSRHPSNYFSPAWLYSRHHNSYFSLAWLYSHHHNSWFSLV